MKLSHYLNQLPKGGKSQFAKEIDVSKSFLCQMASGKANVPIRVAKKIEEHTHGQVTKAELRPDVWG
ncbi:helix-turn-helix domain-containing protein [Gilliamella sp. B2776]|uniref:transcriptional regulator n=1 Tax=unclassified Gilliamella TaxID=2685620 RepID=UPI00226A3944|nr:MULTISPECIES: YdaS family helix-turn-helix protein [unclassified Gilliamella]MCX8649961.1 helix-turn-helix domain-containing protein [Gilliamella sp. B2779]MCX8653893.1 helix-turn-helix domain-containing protein [Gilliamella sp. B2737]MCX8665953.1 helix-turn-helix domain-containing protein [Gilliamella sp. B2887]MCX8691734.1 helix-turn-helix domain-containing protein [Gilliamella sp. B2776]MCX8696535.1 helix-turn-helix domain-containing protein [Gilliamella sp. B2828]